MKVQLHIRNAQPGHVLIVLASLIPLLITVLYAYTAVGNALWRDQWDVSAHIAVGIKAGTLSPGDFFAPHAGHLFVYNYLSTAFWTLLNGWNVEVEAYFNLVLATINLGLLVALFARHFRESVFVILVPLSVMVFALQQDENWTTGFLSYSQHTNLLVFITLLILQRGAVGWRTLGLAALCAVLATFASGNGLVIWGAVFIMLPWMGYRQKDYLGAWLVTGAFAAAAYVLISGVGVSGDALQGDEMHSSVHFRTLNPLGIIHFALIYIGNNFTFESLQVGLLIGVAGVVVGTANLYALWDSQYPMHKLTVWISLMTYVGGNGILTALGRLKEYDQLYMTLARASHYRSVTMLFWVALMVIMLQQRSRVLRLVNAILVVIVAGFFLHTYLSYAQVSMARYGVYLGHKPDVIEGEVCLRDFPLTRNMDCFDSVARTAPDLAERAFQVAVYRLSVFHDIDPISVLGSAYNGSPVIVDTDNPWLNLYVQKMLLDGVPESAQFHITSPAEHYPIPPESLPNLHVDFSDEALSTLSMFIEAQESVWYISTPETAERDAQAAALLVEAGYLGTVIPIEREGYQHAAFTVTRFQKTPDEFAEFMLFDETISLQAWTLIPDALVPCETLTFQSWWTAHDAISAVYSSSLKLVDAAGQSWAQFDHPIANIPMPFWEPGQFYFDERTLQIPCDLPAGTYELQFSIYDLNTLENLPVPSPTITTLDAHPANPS